MRKEHKGKDVILLPDSVDEFRAAVLSLNKDKVPFKSYCQAMIVLTYTDWLLTSADIDAK